MNKQFNLLNKVTNLFEKNNIEYFLNYGTLLGAVREGTFLSHDSNDIDLGVAQKDYWKVRELFEKDNEIKYKGIWRNEVAVYLETGCHLDVFFYEEENGYLKTCAFIKNRMFGGVNVESAMIYKKENIFPLKSINFCNKEYPCPNNPEAYLEEQYGKNWRIPEKKWFHSKVQCFDDNHRTLGILIPTFLRDKKMMASVKSLLNICQKENNKKKFIRIYIGDQGYPNWSKEKENFYNKLKSLGHKVYRLPFNSGLSYARNFLVEKSKEKYLMIVDDDFEFTKNTNLSIFLDILNHKKENGIVGGDISNRSTYHADLIFEKIDNDLHLYRIKRKNQEQVVKRYNVTYNENDYETFKYYYTDIVLNFFIAKREVLEEIPLDNNLKIVEHSVTKDTSVLIKDGYNQIKSIPIKFLFYESSEKSNKTYQFMNSKTDIWTDNGWQNIKKVIRHKVTREVYSILTNEGYIECTSDHSLIINNKEVKPSELKIGDTIELCKYPSLTNKLNVDKDWAWLLGLFLAEGCYRKDHSQCDIANQDLVILEKAKNILQKFGIDSHIVLNMHKKNHCNYLKLKPFSLIDSYFSSFYIRNEKIIPAFIYDFNKEARLSFFEGFWDGDGTKGYSKKNSAGGKVFSQKTQSINNGLLYLLHDIYLNYNINHNKNKYGDWFVLNLKKFKTRNKNVIKKIYIKTIEDYFYDVETENHHFCGGIGNVNLHNTDHFLRIKKHGKWKVCYCPSVTCRHIEGKSSIEYNNFRQNIDYVNMFFDKWGIKGERYFHKIEEKPIEEIEFKENENKKIKVVQIARIPCANSGYELSQLLNKYSSKYESKYILGHEYGKRNKNIPYRQFPYELFWEENPEACIQAIREADIVHIHHDIWDEILPYLKGKKIVSTLYNLTNSLQYDNCLYNQKYIKKLKDLGMITVADQPLQKKMFSDISTICVPLIKMLFDYQVNKGSKIRVGFSPTNRMSDGIGSKRFNDVMNIIEELKEKYNFEFDLIEGVPYKENIRRKAQCHILIDDVDDKYEKAHNTSLEASLLDAVALTNYSGYWFPAIKTNITTLKNTLEQIFIYPNIYKEHLLKLNKWKEEIYQPTKLCDIYENVYEKLNVQNNLSICVKGNIEYVFKKVYNIFLKNNLKCCILNKTCLETVIFGKICKDTSCLYFGVDDLQKAKNILNKINTDNIKIHLEKYSGKTKVLRCFGMLTNVPFPVINYLINKFGRNWRNYEKDSNFNNNL